MSNELRCSHCDRVCREGEKYCSYCHEPIVNVAVSDGNLDGIPLEYWESFIDNNADKYVAVFKKHSGKTWFTDFHFPAFLITLEWMAYRKMYWQAAVVWLIRVLFAFAMVWVYPVAPTFAVFGFPLLQIALQVVFGLYAHAVYKQHCLRKLNHSVGSVADGGVTILGVVVYTVLCDLLTTFLLQPLLTAMIYNLS